MWVYKSSWEWYDVLGRDRPTYYLRKSAKEELVQLPTRRVRTYFLNKCSPFPLRRSAARVRRWLEDESGKIWEWERASGSGREGKSDSSGPRVYALWCLLWRNLPELWLPTLSIPAVPSVHTLKIDDISGKGWHKIGGDWKKSEILIFFLDSCKACSLTVSVTCVMTQFCVKMPPSPLPLFPLQGHCNCRRVHSPWTLILGNKQGELIVNYLKSTKELYKSGQRGFCLIYGRV